MRNYINHNLMREPNLIYKDFINKYSHMIQKNFRCGMRNEFTRWDLEQGFRNILNLTLVFNSHRFRTQFVLKYSELYLRIPLIWNKYVSETIDIPFNIDQMTPPKAWITQNYKEHKIRFALYQTENRYEYRISEVENDI